MLAAWDIQWFNAGLTFSILSQASDLQLSCHCISKRRNADSLQKNLQTRWKNESTYWLNEYLCKKQWSFIKGKLFVFYSDVFLIKQAASSSPEATAEAKDVHWSTTCVPTTHKLYVEFSDLFWWSFSPPIHCKEVRNFTYSSINFAKYFAFLGCCVHRKDAFVLSFLFAFTSQFSYPFLIRFINQMRTSKLCLKLKPHISLTLYLYLSHCLPTLLF